MASMISGNLLLSILLWAMITCSSTAMSEFVSIPSAYEQRWVQDMARRALKQYNTNPHRVSPWLSHCMAMEAMMMTEEEEEEAAAHGLKKTKNATTLYRLTLVAWPENKLAPAPYLAYVIANSQHHKLQSLVSYSDYIPTQEVVCHANE
ncbi:hypothetical protein AXF42_Ash008173 [Apostasia shenzhenica]|uniref:Uncharacterized protein n=1 Tax=Apostasia shenzhenica TaxID=1088818 RepID=A0A2I0A8T2_9ASPA|nr:hypothetical protein AXF42_Ash008173 [Apostasia shenzhenica]